MKNLLFRFSHLKLAVLGCLAVGAFSCHPGTLSIEEADIVATHYDSDFFNRSSPQTYVMPDTVGVIGSGDPQLDRQEMDFILDQIERNFDELGYDRLTLADLNQGATPDVVVLANALVVNVVGTGCIPYWPGWGWWPGWGYYPPGWGGWCYPTYLYSYNTGTLAIDMIDPSQSSSDDGIKRVWEAGLNGVLRSNVGGNQNFIRDGIDKAFELSPYLAP